MTWDRFDIVDAHYWFCVDFHTGQGCWMYARQCRISGYFSPSPIANGPQSENGRAIYDALVERHDFNEPIEPRMMGLSENLA